MTIITIPDRYTCRGLTFLPHGQQYTGPVPPGEYDMLGECDVCYSDLGQSKRGRAEMLVRAGTGERWYVGLEVGAYLRREHVREGGAA
jgi:hypothetical protein